MEKGELNWAVIGCGVIANEMEKLGKEWDLNTQMSYGDILLMILTSQKALASIGSQCLFYLFFCCENKYKL